MKVCIGVIWIFLGCYIQAQEVFNPNVASTSILLQEDDINTSSYEFAPVFFGEYIAFVYDKGNSLYYDEVYDTPYFDMAFAAKNTLGNLSRKASFVPELSSEHQEGPFTFFNNDHSVLFTRTHPTTGQLLIYESHLSESGWSPGEPVFLMGESYHVCHPSISESGNHLAFAGASVETGADMDLYLAKKTLEGWGDVVKLDDEINSDNNDWFPRFIGDSILTFASMDEGLDIFAIKLIDGKWSAPVKAPPPFNSADDDFGLIVDHEIAYFSSNRQGSKGKDDLYRVEFKGDLFAVQVKEEMMPISIRVQDKLTLSPVYGAKLLVTQTLNSLDEVDLENYQIDLIPQQGGQGEIILKLKPKNTGPSQVITTDEEGQGEIVAAKSGSYLLEISHPDYSNYTTIYDYNTMGDDITLVLEPLPDIPDTTAIIKIPTTTGSVIVFENIYYDFNSHVILEGAASELDALVTAMIENPKMVVQLSAHTDSRGTRLYNQRLSEKRASSARDYLISKRISPTRITTLGYGESQLRNECGDGVTCTEEQHKFNRRTEVKILSN